MWLSVARDEAVRTKKDIWIVDLYENAMAAATDADKQIAAIYRADRDKHN